MRITFVICAFIIPTSVLADRGFEDLYGTQIYMKQETTNMRIDPGTFSCDDQQGEFYDDSVAELSWDYFSWRTWLHHDGHRLLHHSENAPRSGQSDLCKRVEEWDRRPYEGQPRIQATVRNRLFERLTSKSVGGIERCEHMLSEKFEVEIESIIFSSFESFRYFRDGEVKCPTQ